MRPGNVYDFPCPCGNPHDGASSEMPCAPELAHRMWEELAERLDQHDLEREPVLRIVGRVPRPCH